MLGTKDLILRLLKRGGPASADEIASKLGLAGMTIRQHLMALERDHLVEVRELRRGSGRPSRMYDLSPQGDASFPRGVDTLAWGILQEVALLEPHDVAERLPGEKVALLLGRYAERVAAPYLQELKGCDTENRARRAVEILRSMSGFVDVEECPEGMSIHDFNCAYRKVARLGPEVCAWHARFLSLLLGCEVCWQGGHRTDCCSVLVPIQTGIPVGEPVFLRDV